MVSYYSGNETGDTPGYLPDPYYWWEAGAMFSSLIDYWFYTNDTQYNAITKQALVHQAGDDRDYMPANASKSLGNDDQGFWGMTAMTAAETGFEDPPADQPQWLALAQAVFNTQSARWDTEHCNGGLRWQIFRFNNGYEYKNTISNGAMLNLAARLAKYTGNATYAEWAEKTWDWLEGVGFIMADGTVLDGAGDLKNCTEIDQLQWSYNAGILLHGAANMYAYTNNSQTWLDRATRILTATEKTFFVDSTDGTQKKNIMSETACEAVQKCNIDQQSFKAYLSRWLAATTRLIPDLKTRIMPLLESSALAAAKSCVDKGAEGAACGTRWFELSFDGLTGVGQQMSALEVMQANLIESAPELKDNSTGTSLSDPNAGLGHDRSSEAAEVNVTTGGTAGAAILTVLFCGGVLGAMWFMFGTDGWVSDHLSSSSLGGGVGGYEEGGKALKNLKI
jgi:mannan endo-1,6-alpha-mannosidase